MQPFNTLDAVAAPLPMADVDTDKIIPGRFLKTVARTGLGEHLFHSLRYDPHGAERPEFVLNQPSYRKASALIAYENFGCGSSREHAVWALLDFGIRCVIAPSFGDIFENNSVKNGLLPIRLERSVCQALMATSSLFVDLKSSVVAPQGGSPISFALPPGSRHALLNGLDDISETLRHRSAIDAYESKGPTQQYRCDATGDRWSSGQLADARDVVARLQRSRPDPCG